MFVYTVALFLVVYTVVVFYGRLLWTIIGPGRSTRFHNRGSIPDYRSRGSIIGRLGLIIVDLGSIPDYWSRGIDVAVGRRFKGQSSCPDQALYI